MSEKATFAAGCFWGVEDAFSDLPGVISTCAGYTGGQTENPTYEQVCTDTTGHAEAVLIEFDPSKITFKELVDLFWKIHNPTTLNRQGVDAGTQYRSAIFFHTDGQKEIALASKEDQENRGIFKDPIVTEIMPASRFWEAEDYHQNYFKKNPDEKSCHL